MVDRTRVAGIVALLIVVVAVVVIVPAGTVLIPEQTDYGQTWDEYPVENSSLSFSAGFGLLLLNLGGMLAVMSYSLLTARTTDEKKPWRELSYYEDEE